jgi:ATP-dependent helicase/nuclease subunit B
VVVDYKTGGHRAYQGLSAENPTANGSRLQLPVYAKAARAALGGSTLAVEAEYWFVDSNTHIAVPLTDAVDEIFTRTVEVIVDTIESGLFPHRPAPDDGFGRYILCQFCDPDGLGAAEHRHRWQRKRTDPRLAAYRELVEPDQGAS